MFENPFIFIAVVIVILGAGFWLYRKFLRKEVAREKVSQTDSREEYKTYLRSEQWRNLKASAIERADYKCELCGKPYKSVHHVKYPKRYEDDHIDNLVVICDQCHTKLHGIREEDTAGKEKAEAMHVNKLPTPTRTYFFDVKRTVNGDKYLTITEYKKTSRESSQRFQVMVFEEDFERFNEGLTEALNVMRGGTMQESAT